jgi:hypothetical protein
VELGHCEREVPLRDAERPLDLLVWSVVDMAFRTGADRVADLRVVGCQPEGPGELGLRPVAPPQGGEGPAADDAQARALGEIALLDQPVRLEVQHLALVV